MEATIRPPFGLVTLCALNAVNGFYGVAASVMVFNPAVLSPPPTDAATALGLFYVAAAALSFALTYGLWTSDPWAYRLSMVGCLAGLLLGILAILASELLAGAALILVSSVIGWYLHRASIRSRFGASGWFRNHHVS
jgi:hypothetical protein